LNDGLLPFLVQSFSPFFLKKKILFKPKKRVGKWKKE
jgi:hypothetical protein